MTRLPRDIDGRELARRLKRVGYVEVGWKGSHMKYTTKQRGNHTVIIPDHHPLKLGMLQAILADVAQHFGLSVTELLRLLELA
jgi:predicted RNA binding protein YcfA (HicA-like mRNA interferase family)